MTQVEVGRVKTEAQRRGMSALDVGQEILRVLPSAFVLRYELIWLQAFGPSVGGSSRVARDPDAATATVPSGARVRTSTGQKDARGGASTTGRRQGANTRAVVADDRAVAAKARVDRALRKLAREMGEFLGGESKDRSVRRCGGVKCKRWADTTWNYCPACGAPTEEVDA
jgi:hypothetical protein